MAPRRALQPTAASGYSGNFRRIITARPSSYTPWRIFSRRSSSSDAVRRYRMYLSLSKRRLLPPDKAAHKGGGEWPVASG